MLARSFLIKSSSKLLVTRTGIKTQLSLILGWIRLLILELLALEWRKFHTFELEYLWSQSANLDQILCVASLGWGTSCIRFWGRLDQNSGFHSNRKPPLTYNGENDVSTFSRLFLIRSFCSSPEPLGLLVSLYYRHALSSVCYPSSVHPPFSKIFSKTVGPMEAKFHVELPWFGGTKVCSGASGSHDQDGRHNHMLLFMIRSFFSSLEPLGLLVSLYYRHALLSVRYPSSVHPPFSKIFSKTIGPMEAKFHVELPWFGGTKVCSGDIWVTWSRWPPRPYVVKTLEKSSFLEPKGQWPCGLVCSIGALGSS